jgi:hypothetical protein
MKLLDIAVAISLGILIQAVAHADPKTYACPQSIPASDLHVVTPGKDWTAFVSSPLYLSGAAPADGPPARLGVLREDAATKTKAGWTRRYALGGQYPEGKWLRCDYGSLGEVSIAKRLPDETQSCTVSDKKGVRTGEVSVEVRCL